MCVNVYSTERVFEVAKAKLSLKSFRLSKHSRC